MSHTTTSLVLKRSSSTFVGHQAKRSKVPTLVCGVESLCNVFAQLPEDCLVHISECITPIDTHSWCCTCRFFHLPSHFNGSKCLPSAQPRPKSDSLAKLLLNSSLTQSLDVVLAKNQVGFNVAALKRLFQLSREHALPSSSILLSGSMVLQACLGRPFYRQGSRKTDADLFCSSDSVRVARAWLVDKSGGNMVFFGLKTRSYSSNIESYLEEESDYDRLDHVEAYGPLPSEDNLISTRRYVSTDVPSLNRKLNKSRKNISQAWRHPLEDSESLRFPRLDFTPLQGQEFPHIRRRLGVNVDDCNHEDDDATVTTDLVVASRGKTAQDLVDTFDLDICMCSYDGNTFRIKNPRFVFNVSCTGLGRCMSAPMSNICRHTAVLLDFFGENFTQESTEERLEYLEKQKVASPLIRYLWDCGCHFGVFPDEVDEVQLFHRVEDVHSFICRAVTRINKYRLRGVNVLNSHHIPHDYDLPSTP